MNKVMIIAAIVIVLGSIVVYKLAILPFFKNRYNNENNELKTKNEVLHLHLFHVDWCPHCKTAIPKWDAIKSEFENQLVNGYTVKFTDINCTDDDDENVSNILNKYNIDSFPTIIMLKENGEVSTFDAAVSEKSLTSFIQLNAV
jgi:thiol-disulfide isomerase/thioredoxin